MARVSRKAKLAAVGVGLALAVLLGAAFFVTNTAAASYDPCSCVSYVRSQTGLRGGPATAAGYTERVMSSMGYRKVLPQAGAILVWDAWQKGARGDGHMAIVNSASYNSKTKKWMISVRQANWGTRCSVHTNDTFSWGDLYGVNAYVRR